ncbi:hypothetical protein R3I94_011070 [Phoxinus phoxinus]
MPPFA